MDPVELAHVRSNTAKAAAPRITRAYSAVDCPFSFIEIIRLSK
jgi:hypothetical protein